MTWIGERTQGHFFQIFVMRSPGHAEDGDGILANIQEWILGGSQQQLLRFCKEWGLIRVKKTNLF